MRNIHHFVTKGGSSTVSWRNEDFVHQGRLSQSPGDGVLSAAVANNEDVQGHGKKLGF